MTLTKDALQEIMQGLQKKQKQISSKYFYDERGSKLFEEITLLKEYYPSRAEKEILKSAAKEITKDLLNTEIIELGSGDESKISILLNTIPKQNHGAISYIPVDISPSAIEESTKKIAQRFPKIKTNGLVSDFLENFSLPTSTDNRIYCFFGSTIGNLSPQEALDFMRKMSSKMHDGDTFLLGLDMVKNKSILEKAYNDKENITAEFNKNILLVMNELLKTNFNSNDFCHHAFYNESKQRIEMHLRTKIDLKISSPLFTEELFFAKGESIHTENSRKFNLLDLEEIANYSQLKISKIYTDSQSYFSLVSFSKGS